MNITADITNDVVFVKDFVVIGPSKGRLFQFHRLLHRLLV